MTFDFINNNNNTIYEILNTNNERLWLMPHYLAMFLDVKVKFVVQKRNNNANDRNCVKMRSRYGTSSDVFATITITIKLTWVTSLRITLRLFTITQNTRRRRSYAYSLQVF